MDPAREPGGLQTPIHARGPTTHGNSVSPRTPSSDSSYDTYQRASECLRKLREDIAIFRDPEVRNHLETIPLKSPGLLEGSSEATTPALTSETFAHQQATIISLRTTVAHVEATLQEMKAADFGSRKRAARAEGQLAELRTQYEAQERAHQIAIGEAASRIRALENESNASTRSTADECTRLAQRVQQLQLEVGDAQKARNHAESQTSAAKSQMRILETELLALQKSHAIEKSALQNEKLQAQERLAARQKERSIQQASQQPLQNENQILVEQKRLVDILQKENVQLKSEIHWLSSKMAQVEKELRESENTKLNLRDQMRSVGGNAMDVESLREKVAHLEMSKEDSRDAWQNVEALKKEKEELRIMISLLSDSQDVQDGLDVLRKLGSRDQDTIKELVKKWIQDKSMCNELSMTDVADVKLRCSTLEEELVKCRAELNRKAELETAIGQSHHALEKEINYLKACVDLVQKMMGNENKAITNPELAKLHSQVGEGKVVMEGHLGAIKSLEETMKKKEKEAVRLRDDFASLISTTKGSKSDVLTKELENEIESNRKEISALKAEVVALTAKQDLTGASEVREGTPDFDEKAFKVVHLVENPLAKAIDQWKLEQEKKRGTKRMRTHELLVGNMATKEEVETACAKMAEMQVEFGELKRKAVLGDRTRQIALKRIEEVRSAVYNLFGWSMKVNGAVYSLSSIYAESPMEVLHFCVNEKGSMSLLDSQYAQGLSQELEQYVQKMNSFPALLSHITMANFEKTTAFMS